VEQTEVVVFWITAFGASLVAFTARAAWTLFGDGSDPPENPGLMDQWCRKRRWFILSELFALPLFTTCGVLATKQGWLDPTTAILYVMICALLGFAWFRNRVQKLADRVPGEIDKSKEE
jgi:hypothetical protein